MNSTFQLYSSNWITFKFCKVVCSQAEEQKTSNYLTRRKLKTSKMRNMRKLEPGNSLMSQTEESIEPVMVHSRI